MSETGVRHMAALLPDLTPILIVRDPVKRMISGLSMSLSRKSGRMNWSARKNIGRLRRKQGPRGDYARMIPLFRRHFGDVMVIPFGQIHTDPLGLMRQIEQQYGLDQIQYRDLKRIRNSHTGKVELQPEVLAEIERLCAPQYRYLEEEFGRAFIDAI
jgi:Sulfotransferase family